MSKSRLFDAKKADQFQEQYQSLYIDLFEILKKKPKYRELHDVLHALMKNNYNEFIKVIQDLQKEKNGFDYYILDYRDPSVKSYFKFPFKRWTNDILGDGKIIRKILNEKETKLVSLKKHENEYKVICEANMILKKINDFKEKNLKTLWIDLKNIKLKLQNHIDPRFKNDILFSYYYFVVAKLAEICFINTIQGLSHRSISIIFSQMLAILVHGDEDMIIDTVINNGFTTSFVSIKEKHDHIFREKSHNHFDDVIDFMQFKKNSGSSFRHHYFELIPLFIRKCHKHQEELIIQEYSVLLGRELLDHEKEVIIEKYLHEHHSISKNISTNRDLNEYIIFYFEEYPAQEEYVLPSFSEYCKQFDRSSPGIVAKMK